MLFSVPINWYCKRRVFRKCSTRYCQSPHPVWRASPLFSLSPSVTWSTCLLSLHLESSSLPLPLPIAREKKGRTNRIPCNLHVNILDRMFHLTAQVTLSSCSIMRSFLFSVDMATANCCWVSSSWKSIVMQLKLIIHVIYNICNRHTIKFNSFQSLP